MPDYEKMYYTLFNAVTDAIELLKQAQIQGEQMFIDDKTPISKSEGRHE